MFPSTSNSPVFLSIVPKSPTYRNGGDPQFGCDRNDERYWRGELTRMRFGGSQFAHFEVTSLMRSMYLRWALAFAQGNTRRAGRGSGLAMTSNKKIYLYKHRSSYDRHAANHEATVCIPDNGGNCSRGTDRLRGTDSSTGRPAA
jgi:hypothetical protein